MNPRLTFDVFRPIRLERPPVRREFFEFQHGGKVYRVLLQPVATIIDDIDHYRCYGDLEE